eukprot:1291322-Amphidinium_carterae.1
MRSSRVCSQGGMLQPKLCDFDAARVSTQDCTPRCPVDVPQQLLRHKQKQSLLRWTTGTLQ